MKHPIIPNFLITLIVAATLAATANCEDRFEFRDGTAISDPSPTMRALLDALTGDTAPGARLAIDPHVQSAAESALEGKAGAIVVLDPRNGEVLALASRSADGMPGIADTLAARTPGAAFLPVTALAGIPAGLEDREFECTGAVTYGRQAFYCWKRDGHGEMRLADALKVSCGPFFYQYGNAAGSEAIEETGQVLGLGMPSGIPMAGEQSGVLPSPKWLAAEYPREKWSTAYTAMTAIGQGYVRVTPLQMMVVAAALANGGIVRPPRLLIGMPLDVGVDLRNSGVAALDLESVRRGMWRSVNEVGSPARRARLDDVEVAGRTGISQQWTHPPQVAESKKTYTSWFVGFAPYENPRVAVCVVIFGAESGGANAAPVAAEVIRAALRSEVGD